VAFRLINRSGYETAGLLKFFRRGLAATRTSSRGLTITVVTAPGRTKGCADVGGRRMTFAIAPPSRLSIRRLAHVFEHEVAHKNGLRHEDMARKSKVLLYSPDRGPTPKWARGIRLRWRRRAPAQLRYLAADRMTRR
jgi:hypothetical protein